MSAIAGNIPLEDYTYLDLGEAVTMRSLNGLAAFTIEATVKLNRPVTSGFHSIAADPQ